MNENENSLRTLFIGAVEIPDGAERAAYLRRVCGEDNSLRRRLDNLLKAHAGAGEVVSAEGATNVADPLTEKPGDRIGRYKLREQIGEGGCGVVYVADQEEPVRRRVALKVIKLGMDTRSVVARFEAERQALAMMEHPNIARVFDAGATDTGRPYFVMELVRGIKITDYCDQNTLSTKQRLELFVQVCHAIQHAHQKGIIHRDIKPSNVLVTLHDAEPVPKVIDFGIAKATEGRLTELTVYTELHQFIGTPAYMSPEQAGRSGLDIDTRSDIYGLGVLLYELLTGRTPFDSGQLLRAGLDEMRRILLEVDPVRPSTRVSTLARTDAPAVARTHGDRIPALVNLIRGDLDWIIMKSLEKDRTRRYETANALAMDIVRHMAHEPVVARPPGSVYRFGKWVRRNKLAFAAASAVATSLVMGLGLSTWSFLRERAALKVAADNEVRARQHAQRAEHSRQQAETNEKRAEAEAAMSRQVARFMKSMLDGVGPAVALGRDTKMLREILDQTAERVGKDLKDQPGVEAELRETIGGVYDDLGDYTKAEAMHREALAVRRKLLGDEHLDVATSLNNLANVLGDQARLDEAETMHREALAMRRKLLGDEHPDVASSFNNLANVLQEQGKLAEAETMHREVLVMVRELLGDGHPSVAVSLNNLGNLLQERGKLDEAETMNREALAIQRKVFASEHPNVAAGLGNLANVLYRQGRLAEAETVRREALAMERKLLGNEHPDVANSLYSLAIMLRSQGKLDEAETMHREALAMRRELLGDEHPNIAESLDDLANVLVLQRKLVEAETMQRQSLAMRRKLLGDEHPDLTGSLNNLAIVLRRQGKLAEAETMQREGLALTRKLEGDEHPNVAVSLHNLASVLVDQRKLAEAEKTQREAVELTRKLLGNEHPEVAISLHNLGLVLQDLGKLADSETMHREALAIRRKSLGSEHPDVAQSFTNLANVLHDQNKPGELDALFREELALARQSATIDAPGSEGRKRDALTRLIHLYEAWDELAPGTGKAPQAAAWRKNLAELEKAEAEQKSTLKPAKAAR